MFFSFLLFFSILSGYVVRCKIMQKGFIPTTLAAYSKVAASFLRGKPEQRGQLATRNNLILHYGFAILARKEGKSITLYNSWAQHSTVTALAMQAIKSTLASNDVRAAVDTSAYPVLAWSEVSTKREKAAQKFLKAQKIAKVQQVATVKVTRGK